MKRLALLFALAALTMTGSVAASTTTDPVNLQMPPDVTVASTDGVGAEVAFYVWGSEDNWLYAKAYLGCIVPGYPPERFDWLVVGIAGTFPIGTSRVECHVYKNTTGGNFGLPAPTIADGYFDIVVTPPAATGQCGNGLDLTWEGFGADRDRNGDGWLCIGANGRARAIVDNRVP